MLVRPAKRRDWPAIAALGAEFWGQLDYPEPYDIKSIIRLLLRLEESGILLLAEDGGLPFGFIALSVSNLAFAEAKQATEVAFYVQPEHRTAGLRLIREAEAEAQRQGVRYFHMISLACMDQEGRDRAGDLYIRRGYVLVERFYRKEL